MHADYQPLTKLLMQITTPMNVLRQVVVFDTPLHASILSQLKTYVDKHVQLTQWVHEKHRQLLTGTPLIKQPLSQQTLLLSREIDELARQLFSHPELSLLLRQPHILPVSARGGFSRIHERWQKNAIIDNDILAVLQHARNRHYQREQSHCQAPRKGRKK